MSISQAETQKSMYPTPSNILEFYSFQKLTNISVTEYINVPCLIQDKLSVTLQDYPIEKWYEHIIEI